MKNNLAKHHEWARLNPLSGPVLAHGLYVWQPWSIVTRKSFWLKYFSAFLVYFCRRQANDFIINKSAHLPRLQLHQCRQTGCVSTPNQIWALNSKKWRRPAWKDLIWQKEKKRKKNPIFTLWSYLKRRAVPFAPKQASVQPWSNIINVSLFIISHYLSLGSGPRVCVCFACQLFFDKKKRSVTEIAMHKSLCECCFN